MLHKDMALSTPTQRKTKTPYNSYILYIYINRYIVSITIGIARTYLRTGITNVYIENM